MSDSKKKTSKANKVEKTTKPAVVKKAASKSAAITPEEKQLKAAIDKYKDIPLGELYEDLNGTETYKDILKARREELIKAKSIADSGKRKVAIAKTSENTIDIEFRYQKNSSFKNHYVPTGDYKVVGSGSRESDSEDGAGNRRQREITRSAERTVAQEQYFTTSPETFVRSNKPAAPRQVAITSTLENRADRPIADAPVMQRPTPTPAAATPAQPMPQQAPMAGPQAMPQPEPTPMAPQPAPAGAPMGPAQGMPQAPFGQPQQLQPQQQPAFSPIMTAAPTQAPVNQAATSAAPVVKVTAVEEELHKKHKLWPLYEQIELVSTRSKTSKGILVISVIATVILTLLVGVFILRGFAVQWNWDEFVHGSFADSFQQLFGPLFGK